MIFFERFSCFFHFLFFLAQPFFLAALFSFFEKSLIVFYLFCVFEILSFRLIIFVSNKN